MADIVDSVVLNVDAVLHCDMAAAFAVDAVLDELVGQAVQDAETADRDMAHTRKAARAVDIVVDELVSNTVADVEVAQAQQAGAFLGHLGNKAVADVTAAQPVTAEPAHCGMIHAREAARAVDPVLDQLVDTTVAGVEAAQAYDPAARLRLAQACPVCDCLLSMSWFTALLHALPCPMLQRQEQPDLCICRQGCLQLRSR